MGKTRYPFMPIYWDDYLTDTDHLSTTEHGAYLLLIASYWRKGGPLRNDDVDLSRTTRCSLEEWKQISSRLAKFFIVENGVWKHKRCDFELAKSKELTLMKKAAADKRWRGRKVIEFKRD